LSTSWPLGRVDQQVGEAPLVIHGQADDLGVLDRAVGILQRRRDQEVTDAAALELGGSANDGQCVGGDAASTRAVQAISALAMAILFSEECTSIYRIVNAYDRSPAPPAGCLFCRQ
jgi:hypothetical protein